MVELASGWNLNVERGPNWLFVRLLEPNGSSPPEDEVAELADELWDVLQQHMVNRVVLELDDVAEPNDDLVGQLVRLQHRMADIGGQLRVCGLNPEFRPQLQELAIDCDYESRAEAIMGGFRPTLPR